jgi:hypothetical protein
VTKSKGQRPKLISRGPSDSFSAASSLVLVNAYAVGGLKTPPPGASSRSEIRETSFGFGEEIVVHSIWIQSWHVAIARNTSGNMQIKTGRKNKNTKN